MKTGKILNLALMGLILFCAGCNSKITQLQDLPESKHATECLDRDIRELTVSIMPDHRLIAGRQEAGREMNRETLEGMIKEDSILETDMENLVIKGPSPVAIRAMPGTPFCEVWDIVILVDKAGSHSGFDVRRPDCERIKMLDFELAKTDASQEGALQAAYTKEGFVVGEEKMDLKGLQAKRGDSGIKLRIMVSPDMRYQDVINVLDVLRDVELGILK